MKRSSEDTFYVYRLLDAQRRVLYIGCSANPAVRIYQHSLREGLGARMASHRISRPFRGWSEAHAVEVAAIAAESPEFNVRHKLPHAAKVTTRNPIADGLFLREHREFAGVKLREVAAAAGVSVSQLSRIETGHRTAKPDTVTRVVAAIGRLQAAKQAAS